MTEACTHQDAWLSLPWLANGRLSGAERMRVEEHVQSCALCTREVALQRRLCDVLTEPERVTYAPGPSFRKLIDRVDGRAPVTPAEPRAARLRPFAARRSSPWRPPGLAWAASFLLLVGFLGLAATTYRWSLPLYGTYTTPHTSTTVLHVAFVPSLSIAEASDALRSAGARVVEGPDAMGIFGVTPAAASPDPAPPSAGSSNAAAPDTADTSAGLRALAGRLRTDTRVRWVEPISGAARVDTLQHGPPQP